MKEPSRNSKSKNIWGKKKAKVPFGYLLKELVDRGEIWIKYQHRRQEDGNMKEKLKCEVNEKL